MRLKVNGVWKVLEVTMLSQVAPLNDECFVVIVNGFTIDSDLQLSDNDQIYIIERGKMPPPDQLDAMMRSRHTPHLHECLKSATVGVAGAGGLGSHVAIALARMGVGKLIIADFDRVEPSNLNRQAYNVDDIGEFKVMAIKRILKSVNPYCAVESIQIKLDKDNVSDIFGMCDVFVEALDSHCYKAEIVESMLINQTMPIVAASGVAGYGTANAIKTKRQLGRVYMVGDGETAADFDIGLMAPRVMIAAAHQANMVVRLLAGQEEP